MFYRNRRFYDEGAGGGEGATGSDDSSKAAGADAGAGGSADTDADAKSGGDKDKSPDKTPDDKAMFKTLTKERDEWKSKHEGLSKKVGKQSYEVGEFRKINKALKENPTSLLNAIAKSSGLSIKIGGDAQDSELIKALQSDDPDVRAAILEQIQGTGRDDKLKAEIRSEFSKDITNIVESNLARRFPDFDELADERDDIESSVNLGNVSKKELFHLAARGKNVKAAIEAAREEGKQAYIKELKDKADEQLDTTGGARDKPGGKDESKLEDVLAVMHGVR